MNQTAHVEVGRVDIETERLLLQPVAPTHAEGIYAATVASRPELLPWMPWAREPSLVVARAASANASRGWLENRHFHFAVVERETGLVLGVVGLDREADGSADLAYWIRSDHARRGLTTEACKAVIAWGVRTLGLTRVTLWAGTENTASRHLAVKLGFRHIGPLDWRPEGGLGTFEAEKYELTL